jgi:hypothetical protein
MGVSEHHAKRALVATKNASVDEVFSYIDEHESDPEFNKPLEEAADSSVRKKKKPRQIPLEIQRLFTQLQMVDQSAVTTEGTLSVRTHQLLYLSAHGDNFIHHYDAIQSLQRRDLSGRTWTARCSMTRTS